MGGPPRIGVAIFSDITVLKAPPAGTIPQYVPPLVPIQHSGACSSASCWPSSQRSLYANAMPPQESPQELPSTAMQGGPFPVRSLSPIQLLYFQFTPERAVPLPRGMWNVRFDLVEANILGRDEHGDDALLFDLELTRANLASAIWVVRSPCGWVRDPSTVHLERVFGRTY